MGTLVMKFGGTSVGTISALTQVISIVLHEHERWDRLILVVSALEGVTDALIQASHLSQLGNRRGYRRITATIRTRHLALVEELPLSATERSGLKADIDQLLFDMLNICQVLSEANSDDVADKIDAIVGVGEHLAARIIAALLRDNNLRGVAIDSTDIIITDDTAGNAVPNMALSNQRIEEHLRPMLTSGIIPVITGFIGGTVEGKPTTLGRGGSDYTASIMSACMKADELWMWSVVDGLMTSDPSEIEKTKVIPELSYDEVAEFAYFGARILHARMIGPLREHNIPLRIKNIFKPQHQGTLIHSKNSNTTMIKAVTAISSIALTADQSGPLSTITAVVDETFFRAIGTHADVMISSQSSLRSFITFIVSTSAGPEAMQITLEALDERIKNDPMLSMWEVRPVNIISIIGTRLDRHSGLIARILNEIDNTPILAYAQGPSSCSFSLVLDQKDSLQTLHLIHDFIINNV